MTPRAIQEVSKEPKAAQSKMDPNGIKNGKKKGLKGQSWARFYQKSVKTTNGVLYQSIC